MGDDKNRHFYPCQIREPSTLPRDILLCPDVPIFLWIKQSWWMNPTKRCILMYFSSIEIHICFSAMSEMKARIESVLCQNIFHRDYILISPRHTTKSMSIQRLRESSIGLSYFDVAWGIQKSRRLWKLVRIWSKVKGLKFKEKQKKGFQEDFWKPLCDWYSLHEKTTPACAHMWKMQFHSVCQETIKKTN